MGWCHEFGAQIAPACDHPMTAGSAACSCPECQVVCEGRFSGCVAVWARGPRAVTLVRPRLAGRRREVAEREGGEPEAGERPPGERPPGERPPGERPPGERPGGGRPAGGRSGGARPRREQPAGAVPDHDHPVPDDGRHEVLEWLRAAFDGVRGELSLLADAVGRQHALLTGATEAATAAGRLADLVDSLPARVGHAVREAVTEAVEEAVGEHRREADGERGDERAAPAGAAAGAGDEPGVAAIGDQLRDVLPGVVDAAVRDIVRPGQGAMLNRVDAMAAELRSSLDDVHAAAGELRNEIARLAAFRDALADDQPSLAQAVHQATERANARLSSLGGTVEAVASRAEWGAVRSRLPFRREQAPDG